MGSNVERVVNLNVSCPPCMKVTIHPNTKQHEITTEGGCHEATRSSGGLCDFAYLKGEGLLGYCTETKKTEFEV